VDKIEEKDIIVVDYGKLVLEVERINMRKRSNSSDNFTKLLKGFDDD
jgi:hypothetical protein